MPRKATGRKRPSPFATRLSPEVKTLLEASAKKNNGGNMSREVERLLKLAFAAQDKAEDEQLRALLYVVTHLAGIHEPLWYQDEWSQRAFKASIAAAVDRFFPIPAGLAAETERESPGARSFREMFAAIDPGGQLNADPERFGKWTVDLLGQALVVHDNVPGLESHKWTFSMPQVREVLGLEPQDRKGPAGKTYHLSAGLALQFMDRRDIYRCDELISDLERTIAEVSDEGDGKLVQEYRQILAEVEKRRADLLKGIDRFKEKANEGLDRKERRDLFRHRRDERY